MLRLADLRENPEAWILRLKKRGLDAEGLVNNVLQLDRQHREVLQKKELQQAELNSLSKQIGGFIREGNQDQAEAAKQKTASLKGEIPALAEQAESLEAEIRSCLLGIPNAPHASVPAGLDAVRMKLFECMRQLGPFGKRLNPIGIWWQKRNGLILKPE
jgi:seryl-tRNA synthetase